MFKLEGHWAECRPPPRPDSPFVKHLNSVDVFFYLDLHQIVDTSKHARFFIQDPWNNLLWMKCWKRPISQRKWTFNVFLTYPHLRYTSFIHVYVSSFLPNTIFLYVNSKFVLFYLIFMSYKVYQWRKWGSKILSQQKLKEDWTNKLHETIKKPPGCDRQTSLSTRETKRATI